MGEPVAVEGGVASWAVVGTELELVEPKVAGTELDSVLGPRNS